MATDLLEGPRRHRESLPVKHPAHVRTVGGSSTAGASRPGDLRRPLPRLAGVSHDVGRSGLLSLLASPAAVIAARALRVAGATRDQAVTMTAIAGRESAWNPLAHTYGAGCGPGQCRQPSSTPGAVCEDSYGLWQINRCAHSQFSAAELRTPAGNARAAGSISGQFADLSPWRGTSNVTPTHFAVARAAVAVAYAGDRGGHGPGPGRGATQGPVVAANVAKNTAVIAYVKSHWPTASYAGMCNCRHERGTGSNPDLWSSHAWCGATDWFGPSRSPSDPVTLAIYRWANGPGGKALGIEFAIIDSSPGDVHVQVMSNSIVESQIPPCATGTPLPGGQGGQGGARRGTTHGGPGHHQPTGTPLPASCAEVHSHEKLSQVGGLIGNPLLTFGAGPITDLATFLRRLPVFLKIAAGGLVLVGGTAVLLVAATGGSARTRQVAVRVTNAPGVRRLAEPVRSARARRSAIAGERTAQRSRAARTEAEGRVRQVSGRVRVESRRQYRRETASADRAQRNAVEAERGETSERRVVNLRQRERRAS